MKACCALLLAVSVWILAADSWSQSQSASSSQVAAFEQKLRHLESNGTQAHPDSSPTELSEQEINAYFASGKVKFPVGVRSVVLQQQPGIVVGTSEVDFDQLKEGRNSYNPMLAVFSGLHNVVVTAHAYGARGQGIVHVDSVSLDGIDVPPFLLELFVEKFVKPKYPGVGIDSRFPLPARVDAATVGLHKVTIIQK